MSDYGSAKNGRSKHVSKRIRVACNNCRKKKIRCDGAARCMNCAISQEPNCIYDEKIAKPPRRGARRQKSDEMLGYMNSRLDRLESMIQTMVSAGVRPGVDAPGASKVETRKVRLPESDDDDETADCSRDDESEMSSPSYPAPEPTEAGKQNEIYLGNHSFFSILSKSSLDWMKNHLSEDNVHLLVPLTNLPLVFDNKTKSFVSMCFDNKGFDHANHLEQMKSPLPKKKEAMFDLIDKYKESCNAVQILCSVKEVQVYLSRYYSSASAHKRNFSVTELFKLSSAILICLSDAMETLLDDADGAKHSPVRDLSPQEFGPLRDNLVTICMGYYYQLSIRGQGLETVKAILYFAGFMAKCHDSPEITHMILTQAIRKGLDMGLHRIETYRNCSRDEFETRHLVWRTACYFDMEMCFRSGKPPIVNYSDISEELRSGVALPNKVNEYFPLKVLQNYDMIFRIRLETYDRLFSATADTRTFEALQRNVDYLNSKMFSLLTIIDPEDRPYFYNQPGFREITQLSNSAEEQRLTTILTYFVNMMTINRLPTMFAFPGVSMEQLQVYRNLSLNSARSIMHLLRNFHPYGSGKVTSLWITYFPLISVLHLSAACMSDPKSPDAHSDILLIIEMCETWFNRKLYPDNVRSFKFDMSVLLQVLVKSVSSIAISIFEANTGIEVLAKNEKAKDSFDAPHRYFPELFGNAENLKKSISLVFDSKSPFPSDGTPTSHTSPAHLSKIVDGFSSEMAQAPSYSGSTTQISPDFGALENTSSMNSFENLLFDQPVQFPNFFFDSMSGEF